jgi:superfamily II DNA or RNA helicase
MNKEYIYVLTNYDFKFNTKENDQEIAKIGSTRNLKNRMMNYKTSYPNTNDENIKLIVFQYDQNKDNKSCYFVDRLINLLSVKISFPYIKYNKTGKFGGDEFYQINKSDDINPLKKLFDFLKIKYQINKINISELLSDPSIMLDSVYNETEKQQIQNINSIEIDKIAEYIISDKKFQWRKNQLDAINKVMTQSYKSGVIVQIMGSGKSLIMLKLINNHFNLYLKCKVHMIYIILCDKQEILKKMIDVNKIKFYKENNIIDLNQYDILDYTIQKNKVSVKRFIIDINLSRIKPVICFINNAYFRSNSKRYHGIEKNKIALVLFDECHDISSTKIYDALCHIKYNLKVHIIGLSATPLRYDGLNNDKTKQLIDIFDMSIIPKRKGEDKKINFISNYTYLDALKDKIVLPINYYYVELVRGDNKNINNDIVKDIINKVLPKLPYKKIIGWCKTIEHMKNAYKYFSEEFKQLKCYCSSSEDKKISKKYNTNYNEFYSMTKNCILLCVNRYRDGCDIPNLDCAIYLDAVETRSTLVSMQKSGRVIRPDISGNKLYGYVIDLFLRPKNDTDDYSNEILTVSKVMDYYKSLLNLSDKFTPEEKFNKLKTLELSTVIDKELNQIVINVDDAININITLEYQLKNINWADEYTKILSNEILKESNLDKMTYTKAKNIIKNHNPKLKNKEDYAALCKINNLLPLVPELFFKDDFKNWIDYLSIDPDQFYNLNECKIKVAKIIKSEYNLVYSNRYDIVELCNILHKRDPKFPDNDLWTELYNISLSEIFIFTKPNASKFKFD